MDQLDVEVGLGPGYIILDGDLAPPPSKGHSPPIFGSCLLGPNSSVDQDATWYEGRPWSRPRCVAWRPSSPQKGGTAPNFRPMSVVTKRLDGSRYHLVRR